jgi:hypothetical protein
LSSSSSSSTTEKTITNIRRSRDSQLSDRSKIDADGPVTKVQGNRGPVRVTDFGSVSGGLSVADRAVETVSDTAEAAVDANTETAGEAIELGRFGVEQGTSLGEAALDLADASRKDAVGALDRARDEALDVVKDTATGSATEALKQQTILAGAAVAAVALVSFMGDG